MFTCAVTKDMLDENKRVATGIAAVVSFVGKMGKTITEGKTFFGPCRFGGVAVFFLIFIVDFNSLC